MLSVSIRSSQTVRSSLAEQSLIWAMGKVLTDTIQCKANLKPTSGRLTGSDNEQGRGTLSTLIQGLGDPNVDDFTLVEIGDFKDSLEVVKMELQGNTGNPKTSTVNRDFVVYYKKKGVGTLEDKPCDSSNTDGCYFQTCSLQYELQSTSNPDVTVCDVQNCTGIAGGNHVAGISCGGGKYLKGFDSNGNKICEDLGECAANQYLKGFDSTGNKICEDLGECANNEYLKGFDSSGNKICEISQKDQSCPSGQYLKGFDSNGNKVCLNKSTLIGNQSCPSGQYLGGFNSSGIKVCYNVPAGPRGPQGPQGPQGSQGGGGGGGCSGPIGGCPQCLMWSTATCSCVDDGRCP